VNILDHVYDEPESSLTVSNAIQFSINLPGLNNACCKLPYFVVIVRALRDEGTSYHYAKPSEYSGAEPGIGGLRRQLGRRV